MLLKRNLLFAILLFILCLIFLTPRLLWIHRSESVMGKVSFMGKEQTGQFMHTYPVVQFRYRDSLYWFNGIDNLIFKEDTPVFICFDHVHPTDARINQFLSMWGDQLVYGGVMLFFLLILFIHPGIIPYKATIQIKRSRPFFSLIEKYDSNSTASNKQVYKMAISRS
jgi:hypothetical protein